MSIEHPMAAYWMGVGVGFSQASSLTEDEALKAKLKHESSAAFDHMADVQARADRGEDPWPR